MTYAEIGIQLGYSREYIRRIEHRALRKLAENPEVRKILEEYKDLPQNSSLWERIQLESWGD